MAQRLALVIGNDDYSDPTLARLTAPQADITAFAELLNDPQRGAFDGVEILHNRAQSDVRREIARFFHNRQRDDLLLLYFSGHGVLDEEGQLYLATPDTERDLLDATAITAHYVNRLMRRCRSRRQVLILDCCHSGAFDRSSKGGGVGTEVGIGEAFAGDGTGHIVLAASKATEYAFEGDEVLGEARTSVFTRALIDGIRTGDADLDEDGYITPEELYDYTFHRVRKVSPRQTPGKWVYEQTGEMILARSPRRRLPDDIQAQLRAIDPLIRFRTVDDLAALMRAGDEALAALSRRALEDLALSDDSFTVKRAAGFALQGAVLAPRQVTVQSIEATEVGERYEETFSATPAVGAPTAGIAAIDDAANAPVTRDELPAYARFRAWNDLGPVLLTWFFAAAVPMIFSYYYQDYVAIHLGVPIGLALVSGFTFQHTLNWAGKPPSGDGVPVLAALLNLIPIFGPAAYAAAMLRRLTSWDRLNTKQRLLAVGYGLTLVSTHYLVLRRTYFFLEVEGWWSFEPEELSLIVAFLAHGAAIFLGAIPFALQSTSPPPPRPVPETSPHKETATSASAASDTVRLTEAPGELVSITGHASELTPRQIDGMRLPHDTEPRPLAITWQDYGPVALVWFLAIIIPLGYTYLTESIELFFLGGLLAMALASGYTFQRLLQWSSSPESDSRVPVLAGVLGIVPLGGPLGYTALLLHQLSSWRQLRLKQRLGAAAYALLTLITQAFLMRLCYLFWEMDEWYYFETDHLWLVIVFLAHGTTLFIGAALLARNIIANQH